MISQVTRDRIYSEFAGLRKKVLASPLDQRSEFVPVGGHRSMARPQPFAVRIFLFIVSATDTFHVRETTCWWVDTVQSHDRRCGFQEVCYLSHLCSSLQREIEEGMGIGQQNTQDLRAYPTQVVEECTTVA